MTKDRLELQRKALAEADAWAEREVNSWADLYGVIHKRMRAYRAMPHLPTAEMAMFTMYAFVLALEDLPEEGNAIVIMKRINHIMFMEPERLGASLTVIDAEDVERAQRLLAALGALSSADGTTHVAEPEEPAPAPGGKKKHLH